MKKVVSKSEVCHLWAHQSQSEARTPNGSLFFTDRTIYSYGSHFPIAKFETAQDGSQVILFTTRSYSMTTAHQKTDVRRAIPARYRLVFCENPANSPESNRRAFEADINSAIENICEAKNKVSRAKRYGQAQGLVSTANTFCELFGLPLFELPSDLDQLKADYEARQAAEKAENERRAKEAAEAYQRRQAELAIENAEKIAQWKAGERSSLPYMEKTYLRVSGDTVETSKGANFPKSHALLGLRLVEKVRESGQEYTHEGHSLHLGPYRIDRIEANGNVSAGCHYVTYEEIASVAEAIKAESREAVNA